MRNLVFLFLFIPFASGTQNLVPNPSFEDTLDCPIGPDEVNKAQGWNSFRGSPDYMNECSGTMSVPNNWGGHQDAASGKAYIALSTYSSSSSNLREFAGSQLLTALTPGTKYFVSFQTSLTLGYSVDGNCASNNLGAIFSTVSYSASMPAPITNSAQIFSNTILTDSSNWVRIFGSFVADSSYQYIILGNFFDDTNTDTLKFYNTFTDAAYYYLDDICISVDSNYTANYYYTNVQETDLPLLVVYPNPALDFIKIDGLIGPLTYHIYDINGKRLLSGNSSLIYMQNLEKGFYYLNINCQNKLFRKPIIKQ